jgi:hypothetical protein
MSMKSSTVGMPERMRAHIHWLDELTTVRRLLHWLQSGSCPECQWRRAGRRTLQRVLSGQNEDATGGVRASETRLPVRQGERRVEPIQDRLLEHPRELDLPRSLR